MDPLYALCFIISLGGLLWMNHKERERSQKTIDELTSKLMARDFKEYAAMTKPPEPEKPKRKPLSWYDSESEVEDTQ